MNIYLQGLTMGLAYVAPIGLQNLFVINSALTNAGALRYNALRAKLDGISNTVLAASLRELEADGLVVRTVYPEVPVRVEYRPTEDCRSLLPILEQLSDWAEARMAAAQPSEA